MNRTVRTVVSASAATGLAFGLGACSEAADQVDKVVAESYEVTYEVTGTGVESIDYHAGDGTAMQPQVQSDKKPTTPWTRTVKLHGVMPPAVMPVALKTEDLTCKVVYQGKVIKEAKGDQAMAGGCVTVSPVFN
ncbi:hypothetical protein [Streptomyces filamentosus]|uniref:hypothetical protein n=1 Tax=Streptomyces filamentosus TaxID=67294 RepID=UPI0037D2C7F6